MICADCGTENRPGRRFCADCGNALAITCANCGAQNEPTDRFCGNCGRPLGDTPAVGATRQPAETLKQQTERRLVTVLFADLVGFTPFAEERDAEDVRSTLERYSAIAREVIGRYGGTIEKFIGDAVMAVWGTPTAHEDDAERAVRAALELTDAVRALGDGIAARAGILSGEAAVDLAATDQSLLAGDLVNTAARLQSVAPAGAVLVGESTMRATSAAIGFEPAGDQELKGKSAPVPAWQALRVISQRGGAGRSESVETPFVGRDDEFRRLRDQLPLSGRDPRASLVSVTGPAGIGKSRLAWELEKYIDGVAEDVYWHRGRCPAYGEGVSFWALGEMVRRRAGLAESDDEATTRERLNATVDQYVADSAERDWIEQALLSLLGVERTGQTGAETLFAAWRRFFENIATHGPTVLVFEDLHWADTGLLDFIDHVLDWSRNVPLLIVTLARPELFDRRPDWGGGRRTFTALALDPLTDEDMTTMLRAVAPDLDPATLRDIVARADGIPLYAVEFMRMLAADGRLVEQDGRYRATGDLGKLAVPQSLRSLITSRLDSLDAVDRRLLQDASVLGQSFTPAGLAAAGGIDPGTLEQRLRSLMRRELLSSEVDPRSPERGQYSFTQSLIREVAYSTLARAERRARHLAAARYLETVGGEELAPVLAGHYVAAHEASAPGPEAEAVGAQARVALRAAAERAATLGGHTQAAALLAQALTVTADVAERAKLQEQRAVALHHAGRYDEADQVIHDAIDAYRSLDDVAGRARAQAWLGPILIHAGKIEQAGQELEAALKELPADAEPRVRAEILAKLARVEYRLRRPASSIEFADQALRLAEHHRLVATVADAMASKGTALSMEGRTFEALTELRGAMDLARRVSDTDTTLRAANNLGGLLSNEVGLSAAYQLARESVDLARSVGDAGQTAWQMQNLLLGVAFGAYPPAAAVAEAEQVASLDLARTDRRAVLAGLMVIRSLIGDDISTIRAEADDLFDDPDDPQVAPDYMFWRAITEIAKGDWRAAADLAGRAGEVRPDLGSTSMAAVFAAVDGDAAETRRHIDQYRQLPVIGHFDEIMRRVAEAALAALEGKRAEALPVLRESLREMRDLGDLLDSAIIGLAMVRLLGADVPEARAAVEQSIADFERMGAPPMVKQLRDALENGGRQTVDRQPSPAAVEVRP